MKFYRLINPHTNHKKFRWDSSMMKKRYIWTAMAIDLETCLHFHKIGA